MNARVTQATLLMAMAMVSPCESAECAGAGKQADALWVRCGKIDQIADGLREELSRANRIGNCKIIIKLAKKNISHGHKQKECYRQDLKQYIHFAQQGCIPNPLTKTEVTEMHRKVDVAITNLQKLDKDLINFCSR